MYKVYNTQEDFSREIQKFLKQIFPDIRKTWLNILPYILFGIIKSKSLVASDIANELKGKFSFVKLDFIIKRIYRFFKNKLFNGYFLYDIFIRHVIKNYKKKHSDKRVHIVFDHMFSKDNFTVFMITMRIGKQGIPLWFRCFKGKSDPDAFDTELLKESISYVSNLFSDDFELIFLADRFFDAIPLLDLISSLGHTFCIRLKCNRKVLVYDKKEGHNVWKYISDLKSYKNHPTYYNDVLITNHEFQTNIVISKRDGVKEPWIIVTNGDVTRAIKDYGYRFGAIECVFKNQKSNGFKLERIPNASFKYFESMYSIACMAVTFLVILGADYAKNTRVYKDNPIATHTNSNGKKIRVKSLFNAGLTLFHKACNSSKYIRIPYTFILYDS